MCVLNGGVENYKGYISVVLPLFLLSCNWRTATFRYRDRVKDHYLTYTLTIPRKCSCEFDLMENERKKRFLYKDSSYIFISDNIWINIFPAEVHAKYKGDLDFILRGRDTLSLNGVDSNGRCWEILKLKNVLCGYWKVPPEKKAIFDSALNSITFK